MTALATIADDPAPNSPVTVEAEASRKPPRAKTYLDPVREAMAVKALRESVAELDGGDELLLLDTIEGETGLFEALDFILGRITETRAMAAGLDAVIADMTERKARYEKRVLADKALIEQAMMVAEVDKIERPVATLFLSARQPKVMVDTEAAIPAEFWKSPEPILDKKALGDALKDGRAVPGACLSNAAPTLTARFK